MDIKNDTAKQLVVIIDDPIDPKNLPNKPDRKEPVTDKKINNKYIIKKQESNL